VRDLSDETKIKAGTSLGRLVQRAVKEMTENDPKLAEAQKQLDGAVTSLCPPRGDPARVTTAIGQLEAQVSRELQDWGCSVFIDVQPPSVDRLFELGTELRLDDGVETAAEGKGHGLQRATLFALIRVWARVLHVAACGGGPAPRKASESLLFAVEEPELFLHPHAQRQFDTALRELAEDAGHQVLLVTHSTHFVNLDHYKEICIISREEAVDGSRVRQCTEDLFEGGDRKSEKTRFHMAAWVDPNRAEMFFARRVVLVEGETEKTVLPYLAERLNVLDPATSVIDCAGKHNLLLYMEVCKAFDLDYCVVHDEDPVPSDCKGDELESKKRTYALNQTIAESCGDEKRIHVFRPDIEKACGISRSQTNKRGKGLAALAYFGELSDADIPKIAIDCTHMAYRGTRGIDRCEVQAK
jgi:putative ATP-dependent endonuclease of the OLD family